MSVRGFCCWSAMCLMMAVVCLGLPWQAMAQEKYKGYTFEEWLLDVQDTRMETGKRVRAIEALTQFGSRKSDTEKALVPLLNDADLKPAATTALKKIGSSQTWSSIYSEKYNGYTFEECLQDVRNTRMELRKRERAIEALTHFASRKKETEKALVPSLDDIDLRDAATTALKRSGHLRRGEPGLRVRKGIMGIPTKNGCWMFRTPEWRLESGSRRSRH